RAAQPHHQSTRRRRSAGLEWRTRPPHPCRFAGRHPRNQLSDAEYVATGSLMQLDELVSRDKIDPNDWLVPLAKTMVRGHIYGLQQDYRIPILMYRKHLLNDAKVEPPRTWADVCVTGAKLTKPTVAGFAIPIGTTGGIGGAQAFGEFHLSTMLSAPDGKYFADDNRAIAFSKDAFIRGAQVIKDQFVKCKSTPMAS